MAKQANYLRHMAPRLKERYGAEKAQDILKKAQKRYEVLLAENKDDPPAYSGQKRERIYPSIALFHALADAGMEREEAAAFVTGYYRRLAERAAPVIRTVLKIPGLYRLVPKLFFDTALKHCVPQAGFLSENRFLSKTEMHFDMVKCPYQDSCVRYGCPELVKGFCDTDDICYGNMHRRLFWGRTKTIGHGDALCDFSLRITEER
nr:L-2-amino-thiazoline-4-carboxylic acid hydrolase [uncultured Stomatobaculum sp.]